MTYTESVPAKHNPSIFSMKFILFQLYPPGIGTEKEELTPSVEQHEKESSFSSHFNVFDENDLPCQDCVLLSTDMNIMIQLTNFWHWLDREKNSQRSHGWSLTNEIASMS